MSRPSQVIVLSEDARHQGFVRQYLYRLEFRPHEIRFEPLPSGRGCGEQWVRDRYPAAVRAFRARASRARTALIVVLDADSEEVQTRARQLTEALRQDGQANRMAEETISHLIPKRSIETWILYLSGRPVDEQSDYSRDSSVDELVKAAVKAFFDATRRCTPESPDSVPSLSLAIEEIARLSRTPRA